MEHTSIWCLKSSASQPCGLRHRRASRGGSGIVARNHLIRDSRGRASDRPGAARQSSEIVVVPPDITDFSAARNSKPDGAASHDTSRVLTQSNSAANPDQSPRNDRRMQVALAIRRPTGCRSRAARAHLCRFARTSPRRGRRSSGTPGRAHRPVRHAACATTATSSESGKTSALSEVMSSTATRPRRDCGGDASTAGLIEARYGTVTVRTCRARAPRTVRP